LSGWFAARLGRKPTLICAGVLFLVSAIGSYYPEFFFFAYGKPSLDLLVAFNVYRIIGGVGVGLASAICPMYIAEVAPSNLRGTLVSWNQFAIIFGQLVVYFVNFLILGEHTNPVIEKIGETLYAVHPSSDPWTISTGWRYMFGSEAVPAGLFALLICFVPETPRYLVMVGQDDRALGILSRINGAALGSRILCDIKDTISEKTERLFTYGWLVIFVGIMLSVFQQAVGINAVLYYAPRIFADMGMDKPMVQTVMMGVVNILFTLVAIFTVEKWGRKPLLIYGSIGMAIGAFGVAVTFGNPDLSFGTKGRLNVYQASVMVSWGALCWVLLLVGAHLLGAHIRDIPQYYPRRRSGHRRGFPVDIQLDCKFDICADVQYEDCFRPRFRSLVHLWSLWSNLCGGCRVRLETCTGNQGKDS